ncbi:tyrosine-protein phosphatase [Brachybacterium sp. DNPG3]
MRALMWDGIRNVRDLGGLPTPLAADGVTSRGRVARGPRRELLTDEGWRDASAWGLRSIVDLRCEYEVGARETDPAAVPPRDVSIVLAPTEDQGHPEFREVCLPILDSPEYWQHSVRILPEHIRVTLEAIASSDPGVFVHCSAGRDRTGMISALLLANAGVRAADIVADYAESVRVMAGTAAHGGPTHDRQASWSQEQAATWLSEVTPHVEAFIAEPDSIMDAVGVGDETRDALQNLLTT